MHSLLIIATLPLAFANVNLFARDTIFPRQGGDAFKPIADGITDNCAPEDICGGGDDSPVVCLIRSRGDTCCPENYGCPGGNFCLIKGFCCPNGDDPATCATRNGITLPPGFQPGQATAPTSPSPSASSAPSAPSSTSTPPAASASTKPVTSSSTTASAKTSSTSTPFTQHPVPSNNATVVAPKPSGTGPSAVAFTGGASVLRANVGSGVSLVVAGWVAMLAWL